MRVQSGPISPRAIGAPETPVQAYVFTLSVAVSQQPLLLHDHDAYAHLRVAVMNASAPGADRVPAAAVQRRCAGGAVGGDVHRRSLARRGARSSLQA